MHHFDYVARPFAKSGSDLMSLFFGHNRELETSKVGKLPAGKPRTHGHKVFLPAGELTAATYVLFETQTGLAEALRGWDSVLWAVCQVGQDSWYPLSPP